jgi:hypothetical protein
MGKKKNNRLPPFVALPWEVLNSKAYKDLNYAPAKALPLFLGKIKSGYSDPQRYLIEFSFSYSEGQRYSFAPSTFSKVIQELVIRGFIDPADKGGLKSDGKSYNLFRLSERWKRYGNNDFVCLDWKCFLPKPRSKATSKKETYSFKKGNKTASKDKAISQFEAVGVF